MLSVALLALLLFALYDPMRAAAVEAAAGDNELALGRLILEAAAAGSSSTTPKTTTATVTAAAATTATATASSSSPAAAPASAPLTVTIPAAIPMQTAVEKGKQPTVVTAPAFVAKPAHIANCVNEVYVPKLMNWDSAIIGSLPAIRAVGAWWSARTSKSPLTIVTQATTERLPQLQAQCRAYAGPLSVVLYQAVFQEDNEAPLEAANVELLKAKWAEITKFAASIEKEATSCHLSVMFVYELFTDRRAMVLYPMNVCRNLARLQARTPMLAMLDVDMLPGRDLGTSMCSPDTEIAKRCLQVTSNRGVVVLPTFETNVTLDITSNKLLVDSLVQQSKAEFVKSVEAGRAAPFDFERYPPGHNWTLFDKWYTAKETYKIEYGFGFEPFVIIDRKLAPWHDVRYRGYGWNKIMHLSLLNYTGFQYFVHPTAFVVHRPHQHSPASTAFFDSFSIPLHILATSHGRQHDGLKIRLHNERLFEQGQEDMASGNYRLFLDIATRNCMLKLPWYGMQPTRRYLRAELPSTDGGGGSSGSGGRKAKMCL